MFDTHFQFIDMRFPVQENQGFFPPSFPAADYLARTQGLGITGGNVVSGSFQGFDSGFMHEALRVFEPSDITLLRNNIDTSLVRKVFFENAVKFYRPQQTPLDEDK